MHLPVLFVALVTLLLARSQVQAYECTKPWQKVNDDICLLLNSGIKSWNHANFLCKFYDSDLLYVNNEAEEKALTNYLNNLIRYRFNQKSYVWLDAKKNTETNKWAWTRNNHTIDYSNWNLYARPDEQRSTLNCACFKLKDGSWKDCDCETTNHFVCRKSDKSSNQTVIAETKQTETVKQPAETKPVETVVTPKDGVNVQVDVKLANPAVEPAKETARITLPQVIDPPKAPVQPVVAPAPVVVVEPTEVSAQGPSRVQADLPPQLPRPVGLTPIGRIIGTVLPDESTEQAADENENDEEAVVASSNGQPINDLIEIMPLGTVEEILTPKHQQVVEQQQQQPVQKPAFDSGRDQSSLLVPAPNTVLNTNSLPTIDQVREDIRPQVESEIASSQNGGASASPVINGLAEQPAAPKPVKTNVEMYLPLAELDPRQYFNFESKTPERAEEPTREPSIVEQDQVPAESLDYELSQGPAPAPADVVVAEAESDEQLPVQQISNFLPGAQIESAGAQPVLPELDQESGPRPSVAEPRPVVLPRIMQVPSDQNIQKEIRVDGGALKLLRLLRPRNRFYRLKPEMMIEESPNMIIRTLSGKMKPTEPVATVSVESNGTRKVEFAAETSRDAATKELTPEDKRIIISSKVMIDEEEKRDRNQDARKAELVQKENEKIISLLNEQSQLDPGKVMIRTSISKSTETFRLFECPNGYGYYSISNTNCNKYKRCDDWDLRNAVLTINKCAEGKMFSFSKLTCVDKSEYVCEDKVDKFVSFEDNF